MGKISTTTQAHLDIADIKNDIVVLKNGGAAVVLEANAINFDLLSLQEQDAAIAAYSSLLNSLAFPIQVTVKSKKMDISDYVEKIKELESRQSNIKIKEQLKAYRHFIQDELVTKDDVLDKKFYITIPYNTFTVASGEAFGWIEDLFNLKTKKKGKVNVDKVLQEAQAELEPKKHFLVKEFARIGIITRVLDTNELIKLYYEIYNSETARSQRIRGNALDYTSALVEPKIA